jgi:diacylglycerol O-acyltransferase / wax synthase
VSLREKDNRDLNNQVSFILVSLATDVDDPVDRLLAISASAATGKRVTGDVKGAIPTDFPSFGAPWLMSGLALLYGRSRLADRLPPLANLVISNVPGPQFPWYLAGAKVASYAPVSIPGHGMALNITVQSYNGVLEFGLTACRRAVPDIGDLADYIVEAAQELGKGLAQRAAAAAPAAEAPTVVELKPARRRKAATARTRRAAAAA